jgi:hypothetical protein
VKPWADLACLAILLVANPVVWFFDAGILHFNSPDAIAYVTLGREMLTNAALYLAAWGHIDLGLILPPLYPLLIGLGSFFCDDLLRLATWISSASLILAGIPFILLIRDTTGRVVAVFAALLISFGPMFQYAFAPLTEALFVLPMAFAFLALRRSTENGETRSTVAAGLLCGLAFLARPVGFFLLAFALMWVAITAAARGGRSRSIARQVAALLAGFLLISGPWAIGLFSQTGQHPLQRTFRMGLYSVSSDDPEVLEEIRQIQEYEKKDYGSLLRSRRMMRKLLPDATEMYYHLVPSSSSPDINRSGLERILHKIAAKPLGMFERFLGNTRSLQAKSGNWLFTLFIITSLTPVLVRRRGPPGRRLLFSAWVWFYILAVSLITDFVARYVVVVVPFVVLHVAVEVCTLASMVAILRVPWRRTVLCLALLIPAASASSVITTLAEVGNAYSVNPALYAPLREFIQEGEVVFAPAPLDAYLLGAGFRILPDDSLDKVAIYAERTGVKWLVVAQKWHNGQQIKLYNHRWYTWVHRWYESSSTPSPDSHQLVKCCETDGGRITLYRFQSDFAQGEATRRRDDSDLDPGQDWPASGPDDGE